jgi:hypothetical protein
MTLLYQFFSKWKVYFIVSIVISAIMCFIGIPIFVYFEMYKLEHWNYFYSFLVTILMLVISKIFIDFVSNKAKKYSQ